MRFCDEKKKSIVFYILEKIEQGCASLSRTVAENLEINQNTVHTYINTLVEEHIIERISRGKYALCKQTHEYSLSRSNGDLNSDTYSFHAFLEPHIQSFSDNVQTIWGYAFTEMINNVMDHSAAETAFIRIEQDFLKTRVFIDDNGVGIFKKIKDHFGFASLDEAICELFKGKLTTDAARHSGEGIFFSSKLMDDFLILSDGKLFAKDLFDESLISSKSNTAGGTCVIMTLANHSQKEAREVFDRFSNVDGGFLKTVLPLKNFFGSAPVSRSQARRVSSRLEKFEEVTLDFEGLDWMGQGFAHELFIVFHNEHPHVRLIPVNMSDGVEKMYRHVMNSI